MKIGGSFKAWRDRKKRTLLAVPTRVRGDKGDGDMVNVSIRFRAL